MSCNHFLVDPAGRDPASAGSRARVLLTVYDEVKPVPVASRDLGYTGTTRWVADRDVQICSGLLFKDCTSAPDGTPYVFEQPLYNDAVSRECVDVYR